MSWLYSITRKPYSSQPDVPWGLIKHQLPLDDTYDTNLLYVDGYDLTWGDSTTRQDRINAGKACAARNHWIIPDEYDAVTLKNETPTFFKNLKIDQLRTILVGQLLNDWEREWMAPYILGVLEWEEERRNNSAAMVAANGDGDDD